MKTLEELIEELEWAETDVIHCAQDLYEAEAYVESLEQDIAAVLNDEDKK